MMNAEVYLRSPYGRIPWASLCRNAKTSKKRMGLYNGANSSAAAGPYAKLNRHAKHWGQCNSWYVTTIASKWDCSSWSDILEDYKFMRMRIINRDFVSHLFFPIVPSFAIIVTVIKVIVLTNQSVPLRWAVNHWACACELIKKRKGRSLIHFLNSNAFLLIVEAYTLWF